jgi:predicted nucleic acid-binding protein
MLTDALHSPYQPVPSKLRCYRQLFQSIRSLSKEAIRGVRDRQFSFWDAQIWATARLNQIPVVFSEDFNSGSSIESVRFIDLFSTNFMLQDWLDL